MSEQTANLCTTDAAESLRAVVAERDREIERLKEGQSILILARDEQKRLANEYRDLWSRAALKAQPSGVVLPERKTWNQVTGREGFIETEAHNACLDEVARLNSSPVSAGEYGDAYQGAREDLAIWKRRALEAESKIREQDQIIENLGNALNEESGPTFMGEPVVSAGDDRETIRAVFLRNGFTIKEGQADLKPYVYAAADELMSIARAALSAPSHGEQVRDGWAVSLMGPDEVVRIQRKDGKWCGVTHLSESPRDRLLYEFLRTIAAPSAGSQKEQE